MPKYQLGKPNEVTFRDYAPDLEPASDGSLLDMDKAEPTMKGYQAAASPVVFSNAAPANVLGSTVAYYSDGTSRVIIGTSAHLYSLATNNTWTQLDSVMNFNATGRWRFAQFLDDVIAVNKGVVPQVATGVLGAYVALAGSPPANADVVVSIGGVVLMFSGTTWYSSAVGADNNWVPNIQTQAATGVLYDFPGPIVAAAPLYRSVIAFKQNAIWLFNYVGGGVIWATQLLSDFTGTWGQECVVPLPSAVAFLGFDDFYITTGYTPERIPNNLKEWFFDTADPTQLGQTLGRYDASHSVIYWHFVSTSTPVTGVPDLYVAYNLRAQRWAKGSLLTPNLPYPNGTPAASPSNLAPSLPLYFDNNYVLQELSGTPTTMRLETSYTGIPNRMSQLQRVRVKYAGVSNSPTNQYPTAESIVPFHVYYLGQVDTQGPNPVVGIDKWHNFRQYDRYHRVQIQTNGPCEVTGMAYEFRPGGVR